MKLPKMYVPVFVLPVAFVLPAFMSPIAMICAMDLFGATNVGEAIYGL